MEADGEIHGPAALAMGEVPAISTEEKADLAAEHVQLQWEQKGHMKYKPDRNVGNMSVCFHERRPRNRRHWSAA